MGVTSGCGEQEVGVAGGSGRKLWVWLLGEVVRRYIDFLILLIPTPLVSGFFFYSSILFVHFLMFFIRLVKDDRVLLAFSESRHFRELLYTMR